MKTLGQHFSEGKKRLKAHTNPRTKGPGAAGGLEQKTVCQADGPLPQLQSSEPAGAEGGRGNSQRKRPPRTVVDVETRKPAEACPWKGREGGRRGPGSPQLPSAHPGPEASPARPAGIADEHEVPGATSKPRGSLPERPAGGREEGRPSVSPCGLTPGGARGHVMETGDPLTAEGGPS